MGAPGARHPDFAVCDWESLRVCLGVVAAVTFRPGLDRRLCVWVSRRDVRGVLDLGIAAIVDLAIEEPPIQFPRDENR